MKSIKDLFKQKIAVECPTQDIWDALTALIKKEMPKVITLGSHIWEKRENTMCMSFDGMAEWCDKNWYLAEDYEVIQFNELLTTDLYEIY